MSRTFAMRYAARLLALALVALVGGSQAACSAQADDAGETSSAYTVPGGHRFVVSTSTTHVVLRTTVGSELFPFAPEELVGKAMLIHPIASRADDGVYARVKTATITGALPDERIECDLEPLEYDEMVALHEDEIVRIYMDPAAGTGSTLRPMDIGAGDLDLGGLGLGQQPLQPQDFGGLLAGELDLRGWLENDQKLRRELRANAWINDVDVTFTPRVLFDTRAQGCSRGIDFGMGANIQFVVQMGFQLRYSERQIFYQTPTLRVPLGLAFVPIGPVPVPVRLNLAVAAACETIGTVEMEADVTTTFSADLSGSACIKSDSVRVGQWQPQANGSIDVSVDAVKFDGALGIVCRVPRFDFETLVAGVAGPFVAFVPNVGIATDGHRVGADIRAGVKGTLFGREARAELELLSWTP